MSDSRGTVEVHTEAPGTLLTASDVAALVGKSEAWVGEVARRGTLPGRKVGRSWRFLSIDVAEYLDRVRTGQTVAATPTTRRRRRVA
jgi:predicted DNA-binding transcriptional regulator AlpA